MMKQKNTSRFSIGNIDFDAMDANKQPSSEPRNEPTPERLRTDRVKMNIGNLPQVPSEPKVVMVEPPLPTGEYPVELIAVQRVSAYGRDLRWIFRVVGEKHTLIYHTDALYSDLASILLGRKIHYGEGIEPLKLVGKRAIAVLRWGKNNQKEYNILEELKPDNF